MNFNFDLFIDILWLGTICGIISSACLEKLKKISPFFSNQLSYIFVHFSIGIGISLIFTNISFKLSIGVGFITWLGAEAIYNKVKEISPFRKGKTFNEEENKSEKEKTLD